MESSGWEHTKQRLGACVEVPRLHGAGWRGLQGLARRMPYTADCGVAESTPWVGGASGSACKQAAVR